MKLVNVISNIVKDSQMEKLYDSWRFDEAR